MQMGAMVVMTLTDTHKLRKGLATKLFDVIDQRDMETSRAYDTVLDFSKCELRGGRWAQRS